MKTTGNKQGDQRGGEGGSEQHLMTLAEAQAALGISNKTMSRLVQPGKDGAPPLLTVTRDPLDRRLKLVSRAEVEALRARSVKSAAAA